MGWSVCAGQLWGAGRAQAPGRDQSSIGKGRVHSETLSCVSSIKASGQVRQEVEAARWGPGNWCTLCREPLVHLVLGLVKSQHPNLINPPLSALSMKLQKLHGLKGKCVGLQMIILWRQFHLLYRVTHGSNVKWEGVKGKQQQQPLYSL